jgi:RND family efflux transporter MFP subunit
MKKKLLILFFVSCFLVSCAKQGGKSLTDVKPVNVKFEPVAKGSLSQSFETAGELKADKEILVSAERAGKIEAIYVSEGAWVEIGTNLVKIKGEDVDADLVKARSDYEAYKALFDQGAISKQELIAYETQMKKYQSQKDNLMIKAISSGVVGAIHVDPGDFVSLGNPIMDLVKNYPLRVSFTIPERLLTLMSIGQNVSLNSDANPQKTYTAKIDFIAPRVDPQTRTILVRAILSNPDQFLKANQYVRVKADIKNQKDILVVRETAIYLDQGQEFLYLAVPMQDIATRQGKKDPMGNPLPTHLARRVPVQTGLREQGKVEILEGIKEGDNIIYAGLHSIYPDAQLVKIEEQG